MSHEPRGRARSASHPIWRDRAVTAAGTTREPSFVGRVAEINRAMRMLGAARQRDGQVAVIAGPAGIGKTRLAEEIVGQARRRLARTAIGQCSRDGESPPLWPWATIMRQLGAREDLLEERAGEPAGGRFARFLAVLDYLRAPSPQTPFVIVVDDVHLADSATLLLARFLARERRGLPLLLLLTRRDPGPERDPDVRELLAELDRQAVALALPALSQDGVARYLSACGVTLPGPELLEVVTAVTAGNPLHLRSLVLQSGLGASGLRGGLEHAVARLLEQVSADDRRLVGLAAVLGPEVSVHEVARVADTSPALAAETLARACRLALMVEREGDRLAFIHDLVREAAASSLAVSDRLDAHARAAVLLGGREPERLLRRAHHAFAAASRSRKDAALAVETAREAARALLGADGFESAAALLARAVDVQDAAALTAPSAELLTERAEAVLACGRLAEARPLFRQAVRVAEAERDPSVLARAALGSSGVWLAEHRAADEMERVLALQRRALEGLPADARVLRARLAVRLAAEEAYRGGPLAPLLEAVEAVRPLGDAHALAEALSLYHNVLMTPEHTWKRLALANEVIAAAAAAGDGLRVLLGLCWRTADLFLLGDAGGSAAGEDLRLRADALRCRSVLFIGRTMEVMLVIRAGRLEEAEQAAEECFALGNEVGDVDALAYRGAHLCAIRFFQGREAELADLSAAMAGSPSLIQRERAFSAAAALFALRAGNAERARAMLQELAREGVASIPAASSWLITMLAVAEMASLLEDRPVARDVYDALLPYADLPVMGSVAVVCFGSVQRTLGIAALTAGQLDLAIEHLAAAVAANERLAHRPAAIQARAELALARLRRGRKEDLAPARALLQQALAAGESAGMSGLVARWREARTAAEAPGATAERRVARMDLVQAGRWRVAYEGEVATVGDRSGMRYLAQLVAAPGEAFPALALVAQGSAPAEAQRAEAVMDRRALAEVRERIRAIREQPELSPGDEAELATLTQELTRAMGLGGRPRSFADAQERARTAVQKAIKRAIETIALANPAVGRHLSERIETGAVCCYRPLSS
jgi:hypothetical protein